MATTKYNLQYEVDQYDVRQLDACDGLYQLMPFISVKDANQTVNLLLGTPRVYRIELGASTTKLNFAAASESYYPDRISLTRLILFATIGGDQTVDFEENGTSMTTAVFVNSDKVTTIPAGKMLIVDCFRLPWQYGTFNITFECKRRGFTV